MPRLISPYRADAVSSCNCRLSFDTSISLLSMFVWTFEAGEGCGLVGRTPPLAVRSFRTPLGLRVRRRLRLLRRLRRLGLAPAAAVEAALHDLHVRRHFAGGIAGEALGNGVDLPGVR